MNIDALIAKVESLPAYVLIYVTEDGRIFSDQHKAVRHSSELHLRDDDPNTLATIRFYTKKDLLRELKKDKKNGRTDYSTGGDGE